MAIETDAEANAYKALETALQAFSEYQNDGYLVVDAVLIIGVQKIDDEGDRVGGVNFYPRHACQPAYVTAGLLDTVKAYLSARMAERS